jgi:hypothetical protein
MVTNKFECYNITKVWCYYSRMFRETKIIAKENTRNGHIYYGLDEKGILWFDDESLLLKYLSV